LERRISVFFIGGGVLKKIFSKLLRSGVLKVKKMTVLAMAW
jgi:hypothetical protein